MGIETQLINTITAIFTFMVFTTLWKENILYRFAAQSYVAAAIGYQTAVAINTIQRFGWNQIISGDLLLIIPFLIGPLFVLRISKTYSWLSRFPTAILVGVMIGISMSTYIKSQFTALISSVITPVFIAADPLTSFNNALTLVIVVCVIFYMLFTIPRLSDSVPGSTINRLARFFMMLGFGTVYGTTIMGRVMYLIGRLEFIFFDWLSLARP